MSGRSRAPSPSNATSARNGRLDRGVHSSSIQPSTRGAMWSSTASIASKPWRGLATHYEKRAVNERAMVVLAAIVMWLQQ